MTRTKRILLAAISAAAIAIGVAAPAMALNPQPLPPHEENHR